MRVFFSLGAAKLFQTQRAPVRPQDIFHLRQLWKRHRRGYSGIVFGRTDEIYIWFGCSGKFFEVLLNKRSCNFTGSVAPEVEEYYAVAVVDSGQWFVVFIDNARRFDKFIGYFFFITFGNRLCRVSCFDTLAYPHTFVSLLYTLPPAVTVHRIESAHNACDFAYAYFLGLFFNIGYVSCSAVRR